MQLTQALAQLELNPEGPILAQLEHYQNMVLTWNKTFNLVSRQDVGRFVPRHLADSLTVLPYLASQGRLVDIGSGAGLPGIPLAIALPDREFTLVERSAKKVRFLKQVVREVGLPNVTPLCVDVAQLSEQNGHRGGYHSLVSRAVMTADALWALAYPLLAEGGCMVLHLRTRGSDAEPAGGEEYTAQRYPNLKSHAIHAQSVPGLQSTHEILVLSR